jgi:hypothetical protein
MDIATTISDEFKFANNHPRVPGDLNHRKQHTLVQSLSGRKGDEVSVAKPLKAETEFNLSWATIRGLQYTSQDTVVKVGGKVQFSTLDEKFIASFLVDDVAVVKVGTFEVVLMLV